ncbi:MAG: hypothetical protein V3T72_17270 [Thermoanaerobaculia bacterium]
MSSSAPRFDPERLRLTLADALPRETDEKPEPRHLYVPPRHARALSPDNSLVVGIRGAGKSVWWRALQSPDYRHVAAAALASPALDEISEVAAGFGETLRPYDYPDKRVLRQILRAGRSPAEIWRTVVAVHTWARTAESALGTLDNWAERVAWMEENPEKAAHAFKAHDDDLAARRKLQLVLFDALDRVADDWSDLRQLLRGLLEVLLELRGFRGIRAKAFVRPDMLDDPQVTAFRDASKVLAGKVELRWPRADLYGLLFQRLGNAEEGAAFRSGCEALGSGRWPETDGVWQVPKTLREDEDLQRTTFHDMAGPWMGTDRKRGFPYTWLPNHLGDAAEQVSPRSFLWALRTATEERVPGGWSHALHYDGIKRGVQEASRIRVDEVREDFFWVPTVMDPLRGLAVPCQFSAVGKRWKKADVLSRLRAAEGGSDSGLLPKRMGQGHVGLRDDLLDLALFSRQKDGRINMPDVYRVGFGLGRRGGVKPIR